MQRMSQEHVEEYDSDTENEEEPESYTCSTFSYYSMTSTVEAVTSASLGFSNYAFCVQSSLKWRAALLSKRRHKAIPVLSEEDVVLQKMQSESGSESSSWTVQMGC